MDAIPIRPALPECTGCDRCSLSKLCLPLALNTPDMPKLEAVVKRDAPYERGRKVFEQNGAFSSCYVVRSGAVKTSMASERGDEKILGFYLPGEIFGLDGVRGSHSCTAVALERSSICEIPFPTLEGLARELPDLQHHLFKLMSREITGAEELGMLLSKNTADERIVSLLLTLSSRHARRKLSPTSFRLPMPRGDIANFLGLAVETVSRVFTRLQKQELIRLNGRQVELLELTALQNQLKQAARPDEACPGYANASR
ncbi:helix-turn-helix domain-containing protein [Hydrocarboniclastica marina]|uniref:Crp/Fnr family transcriptional regulator n=1 Tax=Hydrocarboniclastica marina TaxID=2259620 RepID=A0A4P7XKK9_9ALTE|nr:helix-turn-helix domain-containing protein [Hydrocarboniclastica marina]QCF27034.1 Crp/Fnr family transcriptional regulator [Hydrocarboniclastica marina]